MDNPVIARVDEAVADRFAALRRVGAIKSLVLAGRELRCKAIDRYLRIRTVGPPIRPKSRFDDAVQYEATDYLLLRNYLKPLQLKPDDVVYEIGCGMGRTLCMLARRPVRRCVGIEINADLARIAQANARSLRGRRCPIDIHIGDALEANYDDGNIFWMNNPFGSQTFAKLMEMLAESLARRPRTIRVAYVFPRHENLLRESGLRCIGRGHSAFFSTCGSSYWTNAPESASLCDLPTNSAA